MEKIVNARIRQRIDTAQNWTSNNPVLAKGEMGIESDTRLFKFGDGTSNWADLPYATVSVKGDNVSIVVGEDGALGIKGYAEAETGAQLVKQEGSVAWVLPDTDTVEGISTALAALTTRVETAEGEIDALQAIEYTVKKEVAADEGFVATYQLYKNDSPVGEKINIPKDYLVKDAKLKTAGDSDPSGFPNGTEYIDFIVNAKDGDGNESHIYLNIADIVADTYTSGNGINISGQEISAKVVTGNGLSVDTDGIKMAPASDSEAGAMSSSDFSKLKGIADGAQVNVLEGIQINGEDISPSEKKANIPLATAARLGVSMVDNDTLQIDGTGKMSVKSVNINSLAQTPGDVLVLDCGTSA